MLSSSSPIVHTSHMLRWCIIISASLIINLHWLLLTNSYIKLIYHNWISYSVDNRCFTKLVLLWKLFENCFLKLSGHVDILLLVMTCAPLMLFAVAAVLDDEEWTESERVSMHDICPWHALKLSGFRRLHFYFILILLYFIEIILKL